jgi:hypothetical protein
MILMVITVYRTNSRRTSDIAHLMMNANVTQEIILTAVSQQCTISNGQPQVFTLKCFSWEIPFLGDFATHFRRKTSISGAWDL